MKLSHSNRKKSSKSSPRKSHSNRKNYKKSSMNSLYGLPGELQQKILEDVNASNIKNFSRSHKNQDIIIKNNETLLQEKYENNDAFNWVEEIIKRFMFLQKQQGDYLCYNDPNT